MQLAVVLHYFHVNMLISSSKVHLCMKYCTLLYISVKGEAVFQMRKCRKKVGVIISDHYHSFMNLNLYSSFTNR